MIIRKAAVRKISHGYGLANLEIITLLAMPETMLDG